jgi:hypothetical protein
MCTLQTKIFTEVKVIVISSNNRNASAELKTLCDRRVGSVNAVCNFLLHLRILPITYLVVTIIVVENNFRIKIFATYIFLIVYFIELEASVPTLFNNAFKLYRL